MSRKDSRHNSDEDLRRLERLAASGDEGVKTRLASELIRVGRTPIKADLLRALLLAWLKDNGESHGVRFWSPEEWKKKGERFANDAGLVMTSEGGWNYVLDGEHPAPELVSEWDRLIKSAGWSSGSETNWCWSFYPARRLNIGEPRMKNKRRNADDDARRLAREAGDGDLLAAERLVAALRRSGGKVKVWVLTAVYDLDFVAFRSLDTMAQSFAFASPDGLWRKIGFILTNVIRYVNDDEREAIASAIKNEDFSDALELYNDLEFERGSQPVTFWWDEQVVED